MTERWLSIAAKNAKRFLSNYTQIACFSKKHFTTVDGQISTVFCDFFPLTMTPANLIEFILVYFYNISHRQTTKQHRKHTLVFARETQNALKTGSHKKLIFEVLKIASSVAVEVSYLSGPISEHKLTDCYSQAQIQIHFLQIIQKYLNKLEKTKAI